MSDVAKNWAQWYKREVRPELLKAWQAAHTPEALKRRSTCVLTALYSVSDYISRVIDQAPRLEVLVVSDFLEVCHHWGDVNMEKALDTTDAKSLERMLATDETQRMIRLGKVQKLSLFLEPSRYVDHPRKYETVRDAWKGVFKRYGIKVEPDINEESLASTAH